MYTPSLVRLRGQSMYRLIQVIGGLSFCMYGYDAGVLGGLIMHPPFLHAMGNPTGPYDIPIIVASYDAAASITAMCITVFTFHIGRRGTILLGCGSSCIGALLQASAYSMAQMIVGRCITGFAIGCISSAVPTYLNEMARGVHERGPANAVNAMFLIGGVPLAYWIDYGFIHWNAQASWRLPIIFQCFFAFVSGGTMYFLPDTPRWYFAKGRHEEGERVLAQICDDDVNSKEVQDTKRYILEVIENEHAATESLKWYMFLGGGFVDKTRFKIVRRITMCFWIPMLGEWMGISFFSYFAGVVLKTLVQPSLIPILSAVITTVEALGTVPLYWLIERVGRRSCMLYTACASATLYIPFIALNAVGGRSQLWAAVGLLIAILPIQTFGWQAIKFMYTSEIAPLDYRHIGTGAAASGEWLMVFITVFAGPIGLEKCGWSFWFFFFAGNIVAIIFVIFLCPETGGKTLEQIDYLFLDRNFPGLRRNFDIDEKEAEKAVASVDDGGIGGGRDEETGKEEVEHRERVSV